MITLLCPHEWRDRDGEHQCRHDVNHSKRRHSCACGSWPGLPGATPITPRVQSTALSLDAAGRGTAGGGPSSGGATPGLSPNN